MDARFYNSEEIDIARLATDLENIYRAQNYTVQQIENKNQVAVQLKKGGDLETLVGMSVALTVVIQRSAGGVIALIGQQKWVDKAAAGAVGAVGLVIPVLLPLAVTAGVGAIRQASLGNQVLNMLDNLVRQQYPGVQAGPVPVQFMPQIQQQYVPASQYVPTYTQPNQPYQPYGTTPQVIVSLPPQPQPPPYQPTVMAPPPAPVPVKLRCSHCNTPYEAGDTFCSGCGRSLTPPKILCTNCKAEIKPGVAFCPKCGTSTFQAIASQATSPAPTVQTPPVSPPPVPPTVNVQPQAAPKPITPPYVPPVVPQEPQVMPKPTVTILPATPKQEPPATPKPKQPQTPVYTPPVNPQPPTPVYTPPVTPQSAPPKTPPPSAPKPILARPASQPAPDPNAPWGVLTFSDGKEVKLSGEQALIGRVDHDVEGLNPEVDLSTAQGSDTVSRIHAVIEHVGSTFTLTDLNSTNSTRINGKRLEPDKATPIADGDTLAFGKVTCTFKKA